MEPSSSRDDEETVFRIQVSRIRFFGQGGQLQVQGLDFRVLDGFRGDRQVVTRCGGKRFRDCVVVGSDRQCCHFHDQSVYPFVECDSGFRQQGCFMQSQASRPRGAAGQENEPSVTAVSESTLAGNRLGQRSAQPFVQCIQQACPLRERVQRKTCRCRPRPQRLTRMKWTDWRHGKNHTSYGTINEDHHPS